MTKRRRLFILIAVIFAGVWLGVEAGLFAKRDPVRYALYMLTKPAQVQPIIPEGPSKPVEFQTLVIITDSLTDPAHVKLRSAWLVVYHPIRPGLYWFPIFPAQGTSSLEKNVSLQEKFSVGQGLVLNDEFQSIVHSIYRIDWNSVLVMDSNAIAQIVDMLGGVNMDQKVITSQQAKSYLVSYESSLNSCHNNTKEIELIGALCKRRDELMASTNADIYTPVADILLERIQVIQQDKNDESHLSRVNFPDQWRALFNQKQKLACEFVGLQ